MPVESCTSEPPRGRYFNCALAHAQRVFHLKTETTRLSSQMWHIEQRTRRSKCIPPAREQVHRRVPCVKSKCSSHYMIVQICNLDSQWCMFCSSLNVLLTCNICLFWGISSSCSSQGWFFFFWLKSKFNLQSQRRLLGVTNCCGI